MAGSPLRVQVAGGNSLLERFQYISPWSCVNYGSDSVYFPPFGPIGLLSTTTHETEIMTNLDIPVQFSGTVTVMVPDHLPPADATLLATKIALARILATTNNPDAPEDDACSDYAEESSDLARSTTEEDWDQCEVQGVGGQWSVR